MGQVTFNLSARWNPIAPSSGSSVCYCLNARRVEAKVTRPRDSTIPHAGFGGTPTTRMLLARRRIRVVGVPPNPAWLDTSSGWRSITHPRVTFPPPPLACLHRFDGGGERDVAGHVDHVISDLPR